MDANLVSTRFRQAANDAGLSQYALAKRSTLTLTEIANWWHGRLKRPGWHVVTTLARVLEVSPFWLMGEEERKDEGELSEEVVEGRVMLNLSIVILEDAMPDLGELMLLWASLPESQQRRIGRQIKWEALEDMGEMLGQQRGPDLTTKAREKFRVKARAVMAKKRAEARAREG